MRATKYTTDTFGRRLQKIREYRGLTQSELASAIGKSRQTIAAWESADGIDVRRGDVISCAQALRCHLENLLAPVEAPVPTRPFWARIKKRLRRAALSFQPSGE